MNNINKMIQALPPELRSTLAPSYQTLAETRDFLKNYTPPTQQAQAPQGNGYGQGGVPANYAAYMQGMQQQMQTMQAMMQQMAFIMQQLISNGGIDMDELPPEQQQFLNQFFGGNLGQQGADTAYAAVLKAMKKGSDETDTDKDGAAISDEDIQDLKNAIDEGEFDEEDLTQALSLALSRVSNKRADELFDLIKRCAAEEVCQLEDFAKPELIAKLTSTRRTQVVDMLATEGLASADGKPNTNLATTLLHGITHARPSGYNKFSKSVVQALAAKYLNSTAPQDAKEKQYLLNLLTLAGFVFKEDGSLDADDKQPFPLNLATS